jgi:tetratricopeptide (TPR) repeat protein
MRFYSIFATLLFVLTLGLYWQTHSFGIVNLDDYSYLYNCDEIVVKGLTSDGVLWAFSEFGHAIWMPVTWLSYMADVSLFGEHYGAMHLHNVLLHAMNAVLVYLLLLMILRRLYVSDQRQSSFLLAAFAGAAVWALHPLRVEPVVWLASRKDVLFAFFEILALLTWIKRLDYKEKSETANIFWMLSVLLFVLACLCKPAAMTFPLLAGLLEWMIIGQIRKSDYKAPLMIAVGIALIASYAQRVGGAMSALSGVSLPGRVLNAAAAFGFYCWKTLWPTDLAVQCMNHWPKMPRFWWQGLLICAGYGIALLILAKKSLPGITLTRWKHVFDSKAPEQSSFSACAFCSLTFFGVAVAPTLGLANFGFHAFADRFTYLPSIGFSMLIAVGITRLTQKSFLTVHAKTLAFVATALLAVFMALSIQTSRQIGIWKDEIALFSRTLEIDGRDSPVILRALGEKYYDAEYNLEKALTYLDRSFIIDRKGNDNIHFIYCLLLAEAGRIEDAKREARLSDEIWENRLVKMGQTNLNLDSKPQYDLMRYLINASIALAEGDSELAKEHVAKVVGLMPNNTWANYLAGKIALKENNKELAVYYWKKSIADRTQPVSNRFLSSRIARLECADREGVQESKSK